MIQIKKYLHTIEMNGDVVNRQNELFDEQNIAQIRGRSMEIL